MGATHKTGVEVGPDHGVVACSCHDWSHSSFLRLAKTCGKCQLAAERLQSLALHLRAKSLPTETHRTEGVSAYRTAHSRVSPNVTHELCSRQFLTSLVSSALTHSHRQAPQPRYTRKPQTQVTTSISPRTPRDNNIHPSFSLCPSRPSSRICVRNHAAALSFDFLLS